MSDCEIPIYVEDAIYYHGIPAFMADYVAAMANALAKTSVWPFDAAAMQ